MRILMAVTIVCLVGISCDDDEDAPVDIVIKTGQECGWCAGRDSLTITKFNSSYAFDSPCPGIEDKERNADTNPTEWNELLATLDWDDFNQVQVNTCAVCADGCDAWISVEKNRKTHRIRFTESSTEIEPIRPFVEKLDSLIEAFRKN
jgi:hypothetical protein